MNTYNYGIDTTSIVDTTMNNTGMFVLFIGIVLFSLILGLIQLIAYWKLFKKANKPGWASIVPIYNIIVMLQIADMSLVNIILLFIPIVNIIIMFKLNIKIAHKFNKSTGFGVGMTFIPIIFVPIIAFSDDIKEKESTTTSENNDFNAIDVINNQNDDSNIQPYTENKIPTIEAANIEVNNQNSVDNINTSIDNQNTINNQNIFAENDINNANISLHNQTVAPSIETNSTVSEPVILSNNTNSEPITNNENIDIPVLEEVKPTELNPVVNNESVVKEIPLNAEIQPSVVEPVESLKDVPNAFNSKPIIETENNVNLENLNAQNNTSETNVTPELVEFPNQIREETTKVCKSCGATMPNIVSVCPNCGTDNE